jgi:hypothetical protein
MQNQNSKKKTALSSAGLQQPGQSETTTSCVNDWESMIPMETVASGYSNIPRIVAGRKLETGQSRCYGSEAQVGSIHGYSGFPFKGADVNYSGDWKDDFDVRQNPSGRDFTDRTFYDRCKAIERLYEDIQLDPDSKHQVIHYYCTGSKSGETRSSSNLCLRALIRQLARRPNDTLVAQPVQAQYDGHKIESPSECKLSVQECEHLLIALIPDASHERVITLVIDALDECEDSGYELLRCLINIVKARPKSVRLLLSSQMHVQPQVAPVLDPRQIEYIQIHAAQTRFDMDQFISNEMEKHTKSSMGGILNADDQLRHRVAKELSARANGM